MKIVLSQILWFDLGVQILLLKLNSELIFDIKIDSQLNKWKKNTHIYINKIWLVVDTNTYVFFVFVVSDKTLW